MLRRNIELKSRLPDLPAARRVARRLSGQSAEVLHQRDAYFAVRHGRLKLRQQAGGTAQLIWYDRADQAAARRSDYRIVELAHPAELKQTLADALGLLVEVVKRRELYQYRNVRIHLDQVDDLGTFLEFEAVLARDESEAESRRLLDTLCLEFRLVDNDRIHGSYADMRLAQTHACRAT